MPHAIRIRRFLSMSLLLVALFASSFAGYQTTPLTPEVQAALDHVSPDSLRGHLSFIASDQLEGRNTPSRGLDIAAEYIAAQFRRAGLEPAGDDGFFQTANFVMTERNMSNFVFRFSAGDRGFALSQTQFTYAGTGALKMSADELYKVDGSDSTALDSVDPSAVSGKVVITDSTNAAVQNKIAGWNPSLILQLNRTSANVTAAVPGRLVDPENAPAPVRTATTTVTRISIYGMDAVQMYDQLAPGVNAATLNVDIPAMTERPVKLHNVVGILRGSDPVLKDTYVFVTAHYDHLGIANGGTGDVIFNGANDDGSGTVSVIEIASALASLKIHPLRSLVFMTVFGEEKGLLGSRYYGRHPIFPIAKTIADVNLEQVGRTDSTEGPQVNNASMTGIDFSDVGKIFQEAGVLTGIDVYKHERNSDAYFSRSDNQALADQGVPAHTICVAYDYPDYHRVTDHYDKIDYTNMAKVDRMIALGVVMISNNTDEPKWNETNPRTARFVAAWKNQHTQ